MTITATVSDTITEEIIEVEFEAEIGIEDSSYSDEFGLFKVDPKPILESDITWDKSVFDTTANAIIETWLKINHDKVEKIFINDYMAD